jgi:putative transposase
MSDYRRWYVPGGTYFFTLVSCHRYPYFRDAAARTLLGQAFRAAQQERPFEVVAIVLLPDHLHCLWTLPAGDDDYSSRWKDIKDRFTVDWLAAGGHEERVTKSQMRRGHRGIWQRRFWEHTIDDELDLERHFDYIHFNPVKHGLVSRAVDWPWSSFHRHLAAGHYPAEWGRVEPAHLAGLDWE